MKKIQVFVVVLVLLGMVASTKAADPVAVSSTQMQLITSQVFLLRIQYFLTPIAAAVFGEAHNTALHQCRFNYAQVVIGAPAQATANAAALIAASTNVVAAGVVQWAPLPSTSPYAGQWDTAATDAALLSQITALFNQLARCDTGT